MSGFKTFQVTIQLANPLKTKVEKLINSKAKWAIYVNVSNALF